MSTPRPITDFLAVPGPFSTFNREERNAVATLYAALLEPGNLVRFAERLGWSDLGNPAEAEVFVEWTYLRDLWDQTHDNETRREAILGCLDPANRPTLEDATVLDFNTHFGAVPRPSATEIQSPGRWSIIRFADQITDADEFRRTCVFKWSFNIKPDLVVQTPAGKVLCIEAKWSSAEGRYPTSRTEQNEFTRREIPLVSQTEVQQHLVNELLGFSGTFRYLVHTGTAVGGHTTVTWADVLDALDLTALPTFVQTWATQVISGRLGTGSDPGPS